MVSGRWAAEAVIQEQQQRQKISPLTRFYDISSACPKRGRGVGGRTAGKLEAGGVLCYKNQIGVNFDDSYHFAVNW